MKKHRKSFDTIIEQVQSGSREASDELFELVYHELKKQASAQIRKENAGITLQATALVSEVWLKLVGGKENLSSWKSREHFLFTAMNAMRRILVDAARTRTRQKRGGVNKTQVDLTDDLLQESPDEKLLALDKSLDELEKHDPVKANLVKLRYFAGLTNAEASKQLGISTATAERYWAYARSWLRKKMESI